MAKRSGKKPSQSEQSEQGFSGNRYYASLPQNVQNMVAKRREQIQSADIPRRNAQNGKQENQ